MPETLKGSESESAMDREEAKTHLVAMKAKFEMLLSMRGLEVSDVFDVAIEALSAEPCEDAISREEVLKAFVELPHEYKTTEQRARTGGIAACQAIVSDLPSVTPKQKMGRWIESDALLMATNEDGCMKFPAKECSVCHKPHIKAYWMDYCPNCGAKMVESEDE